eukprot:IDg3389t1
MQLASCPSVATLDLSRYPLASLREARGIRSGFAARRTAVVMAVVAAVTRSSSAAQNTCGMASSSGLRSGSKRASASSPYDRLSAECRTKGGNLVR